MAHHTASGPRAWLLGSTALLPVAFSNAPALAQSPTGGQVVAGQASIAQSGNTTVVTQSTNRGAINWQQFNVGRDQAVQFQQPNAGSWTLNRITGPDPSSIAGRVTANGGIAIVNPSGVVFAGTAQVNVANLIASTANITNENFMAGRMHFNEPGRPGARVENHGSITVADRGMAALVAPGVSNTGTIRARLGRVALQGAEAFTLDLAGDGLLSIDVTQAVRTAPSGQTALVTNSGTIDAAGGSILISAHAASGLVEDLVRHTGRLSAETVAGRPGQVALTATGGGVQVAGTVNATGAAGERGGSIAVRGGTATTLTGTARVDASGAAGGGTVVVGTTGVGRNQAMSNRTTIARGATVRADATVAGQGGTIAVNATDATVVEASLSARGGPQGGDGGFIELSSQGAMQINAGVDLAAPVGRAGTFLLDPQSIRVVDALPADPVVAGGAGSVNDAGTGTVRADSGNGITFVAASALNALGANVQLEAKDNISVQGALSIGTNTLRLFANGAIDQTGTGTITAATLIIRALNGTGSAGSASLGLANAIGALDAKVTGLLSLNNGTTALSVTNGVGNAVTLITTKALTLNGAVGLAGGTVTLNAGGAITQTANAITASTLIIRGSNGTTDALSAVLNKTNAIDTLDARATGAVTLNNGTTALAVTNAVGNAITLVTIDALALNGAIGLAGGTVVLNADKPITQTIAGIITADSLTIRGSNGTGNAQSAMLDKSNAVGTLDARVNTDLTLNNGTTALATTNAVGSAVTLITTKALALNGAVGLAGATVTLNAGGAITQSTAGVTADTLIIRGSDGIADAASAVLGQTNAIGKLDARATGAVTVANGTTTLQVANAVGNAVALSTTKNLILAGPVGLAGGTVTLNAGEAISQNAAGTVTATTLTVRGAIGGGSAAGSLDLRPASATNAIGTLDAITTGGLDYGQAGPLTVQRATGGNVGIVITTGALDLAGTVSGGIVNLTATASTITQSGGGITATTRLGGVANGAISLDRNNSIAALRVQNTTGDIAVRSVVAMDASAQAGAGDVALTGNSLKITTVNLQSGVIGAKVSLTSLGGGITQDQAITAVGGAATALTLDATGTAKLIDAGNRFNTLTATATGALDLASGSNLSIVRAAGSGVGLVTTGALAITASAAGGLGIDAAGNVALTAAGLTINSVTGTNGNAAIRSTGGSGTVSLRADTVTGAGVVSATTTGTVEIGPSTAGRDVAITVANPVGVLALAPGLLTTQMVTGTLRLGETTIGAARRGGALTQDSGLAPTGGQVATALALVADGALTINSAIGRNDLNLSLRAAGTVSQSIFAPITAATLTIRGVAGGSDGAGGIALGTAGNALAKLDAISTAGLAVLSAAASDLAIARASSTGTGQAVTLSGAGGATLSGDVGGTDAIVGLRFSGGIGQSAGAVTGAALLVRDFIGGTTLTGAVALDQANAVGKIDIAAGPGLSFNNGATTLVVDRATTTPGAVTTSLTTTGALSLNGAIGGDAAGSVVLNASGAIDQTAGAITAAALTIRGGAGGSSSASSVTLDKTNAVASLDARSAAGLTFVNDATPLAVAGAVGTSVILTTAGAFVGQGAIGASGGTVALNVDGEISQSGGAITAASLTIRDAASGLNGPAGVALGQANAVGKLDAISTKDLTFTNGATDLIATRATAAAGQSVTLTGGAGVVLGTIGGSATTTVALNVAGALAQGSGGISASSLTIRGTGGTASGAASVVLGQASNAVASLDAISAGELTYTNGAGPAILTVARATTAAGQAVAITGSAAVDLVGPIGGTATTDVGLFVAGAVSQSGGAITAGSLTIADVAGTGSAGSIALNLANAVGTLDAKATGALGFNNGGSDLVVNRATTGGGFITTSLTTKGGLQLAGAVGGSASSIVLLRADGAVTQTAAGITAGSLTVTDATGAGAAASIDLTNGNAIDTLRANATGALAVTSSTDLAILRAQGGTVNLGSAGVLSVTDLAFGGLGVEGITSVALTGASMLIGTGPASNGNAGVRATDAVNGAVTLRTDSLGWTGLVRAPLAVEIGPLLSSTPVVVNAGAAVPGAMTISVGLLTSARMQTGTLRIGGTTIGGSTVLGSGVSVQSALTPEAGAVTDRFVLMAGGAGTISLEAAIGRAGLDAQLLTQGAIGQTAGGLITAGTLLLAGDASASTATGAVTLDQANAVASLQAFGSKDLSFANGAAGLSLVSAITGSGQAITVASGGSLILTGDVGGTASTSVNLHAVGALTQTGGLITTSSLTVRDAVGGVSGPAGVSLDRTNAVASIDAVSTKGLSFVNDATALTVARATTTGLGQTVTLTTGGTMALGFDVGGAGATVNLNAPGVITQAGGKVTAATLTIRDSASGGGAATSINLSQTNTVGSLDAFSKAGLAFTNDTTALTVLAATGSDVTLRGAGDLIGQGAIGGSGATVALNIDGAITQTGGAITAASLAIRDAAATGAAAGISLTQANRVGSLDAFSKAGLAFTNDATDLSVARAVAGAGQTVTLTGGSKMDLAGDIGGTPTTEVNLNVIGGLTQSAGVLTASSLTIRDSLGGVSGPAGVSLDRTNATSKLNAISTKGLSFTNGTTDLDVALATGGASQTVTITAGAKLDLSGNVGGTATTTLFLNTPGEISQSGGLITAGSLTIRDTPGGSLGPAGILLGQSNAVARLDAISIRDLSLVNGANDLVVLRATAAAGQQVTLTSGAALDLAGAVGGTTTTSVLLHALGPVTQSGGVITAGNLTILDVPGGPSGPAGVVLDRDNSVARLDAVSTEDLRFRNDSGGLTVARAIAGASRFVRITTPGSVDLAGDVGGTATTTVNLLAFGTLSQSGGTITAGALSIRDGVGGSSGPSGVALNQTNTVSLLDALSSKGLAITNGSTNLTVSLATAAAGQAVTITTGARLDLSGTIGGTPTTAVALNAPGALSQSGGVITAGSLTIRDTAAGTTGPAGVALGRNNAVASLDATSTAGLIYTNGATDLTVARATSGVGQTVTLTGAGAIALAGDVGGSAATVNLIGSGATGQISQSSGLITAATLNVSAPQAITLGRDNSLGAIQANATTGDITIRSVASTNVAAATGGGTITLTGDALAVTTVGTTAGLTADAVTLTALTGAITQIQAIAGKGGGSAALTLAATGPSGAATLTNAGNRIASIGGGATGVLAAVSATDLGANAITAASIALTGTSIAVNGTQTTPTISLTATGGTITQASGAILTGAGGLATALTSRSVGATSLTDAANRIGDATVMAGSGGTPADVALTSASGLTLRTAALGTGTAPVANAGARDITLIAPTLTLAGVRATGRLTATTTGTIGQTAAFTAGGTLSLDAGGAITLDRTDNAFATLSVVSAGGASVLRTTTDLATTAGVTIAGGLALRSDGGLTIGAAGPVRVIGSGDATLAAGSTMRINGNITAAGGASLTSGGAMTVDAAQVRAEGGALVLAAIGSSITLDGGARLTASAAANLVAGSDLVMQTGTLVSGASTRLEAVGALTLRGAEVTATAGDAALTSISGSGVNLINGSSLLASGRASVTSTSLAISSASITGSSAVVSTGAASLDAGSITATSGDVALTLGGSLALTNGSRLRAGSALRADVAGSIAVVQSSIESGGVTALRGGGGITFDRSTGLGGAFGLDAGQGMTLTNATLRATAGDVTVRAGGGMTATALTVGADAGSAILSAGGGGAFANSRISARDTISVSAAASLAFTDVVIDPTTVLLTTGGDFAGSGLNGTSSGLYRIAAGGNILLTASVFTADVLEVVSGQPGQGGTSITLDGIGMTVGSGAFLAAGGGVLMPGLLTIQPLNPGRLAPLVIETRRGPGVYTSLPTTVQPDVPGLDPADQASQVATRLNPTSAFAPTASTDPGGVVVLNLAAADLPVFLLLNGGSATGDIIAGRLSVHGAGGRVSVAGRLGPFDGSAAASRARLSSTVVGTFQPADRQNYRFNNCVLGSVNCTVLAVLVPVPVPTREITELRIAPTPRDPDALLPNIAEEDF